VGDLKRGHVRQEKREKGEGSGDSGFVKSNRRKNHHSLVGIIREARQKVRSFFRKASRIEERGDIEWGEGIVLVFGLKDVGCF
jgi:hypothetical protein